MTEWLSSLEWGDVPTWLSSLGGIGALIAATLAARASLAVLKIETERDNDADEREQRAQADLVAAWLVRDANSDGWEVCVANESKVPVYDVEVIVNSSIYPDSIEHKVGEYSPVVPPGRTALPFPEVPVHTAGEIVWLAEGDDPESFTIGDVVNSDFGVRTLHKVSIAFSDAAGVRWERSGLGALTRVPPVEANVLLSDPYV